MAVKLALPQELFDNVIGHFYDDRIVLEKCALVCRAWLQTCRSHIFHRVSLTPPKPTRHNKGTNRSVTASQRLYKLLETTPDIIPHIRELDICEGIVGREWMAHDRNLPVLLRSMTNLCRFELRQSASMRIVWQDLPRSLRDSLIHIFSQKSLIDLKLVGLVVGEVEEFQRLLGHCKNLRTLWVDHVVVGGDTSRTTASSDNTPLQRASLPLDVLTLGPRTSTAIVSYLLHPGSNIDLTSVRRLSIAMSSDFADYARLLRSMPMLKYLEIVLMNDIDLESYWILPLTDRFDLSYNPRIETLEIKIDVIQKQHDPLPWLCALFRTYAPSPHSDSRPCVNTLEDIWIVYAIYLPAPYMDRSVGTTIFDGWLEIDGVLTGGGYEALKWVRLDFMLENPIGFGVAPRFLAEVNLQSPVLDARGMLMIDAFDTSA